LTPERKLLKAQIDLEEGLGRIENAIAILAEIRGAVRDVTPMSSYRCACAALHDAERLCKGAERYTLEIEISKLRAKPEPTPKNASESLRILAEWLDCATSEQDARKSIATWREKNPSLAAIFDAVVKS
jgi:hypothetical protein